MYLLHKVHFETGAVLCRFGQIYVEGSSRVVCKYIIAMVLHKSLCMVRCRLTINLAKLQH